MDNAETSIPYLSPGHGKTKLGYLWTTNSPGGDTVFAWHTSRAAECLNKIIPEDFTGPLQCDAYSAYPSFAKKRQGTMSPITLAGCWAHARRRFFEAQQQTPIRAGWLLRQIAHLYHIESQLRESKATPTLRAVIRASHSKMIHQRIHRALLKWKSLYLPKSPMAVAINYALSNWKLLSIYLDNGRVEIDNNLIENAIRPTAIGKKNHLFFGDADAGHHSAILYTIVESCRRHHIDPYTYLRDTLQKLPHSTNWQIPQLTPRAWAQKHLHATVTKAA